LTPRAKVLLIREMQSGFTGNDDERAILTLLLHSDHADVVAMFGPGGLDPADLDTDFHTDEEGVLREFYARHFEGGLERALAGGRKLRPERLPRFRSPYRRADLEAALEAHGTRLARKLREIPRDERRR